MRLFLSILLFAFTNIANAQEAPVITRIIDADSYIIHWKAKEHRARLANVDAPEIKQPFGIRATAFVDSILDNYSYFISVGNKDVYQRYLIEIETFLGPLDSLLVANGLAWHMEAYSSKQSLSSIMFLAQKARIGLWKCGLDNVCPPWVYRKFNHRNKLLNCYGCRENDPPKVSPDLPDILSPRR